MLKRRFTHFLRAVILLWGAIVLALCLFALPEIWRGGSVEYPLASQALLLIVMGLYATALPFFLGLGETLKLLNYIDQNKAFSDLAVEALGKIKTYATIIAVLYVGGVPLVYPIAQADDAPGLIIMGMVVASAPVAVAVFAAVLERLLKQAIQFKAENELTV